MLKRPQAVLAVDDLDRLNLRWPPGARELTRQLDLGQLARSGADVDQIILGDGGAIAPVGAGSAG